MNENNLQEALSAAYAVSPLSEDRLTAIGREARLAGIQSGKRRRLLIGFGAAVGLSASVGFTYPIAAANLFGRDVQSSMSAVGPYEVRIKILGVNTPGAQVRQAPIDVLVDGNEEYIVNPSSGSKTFVFIDSSSRMHEVHPASNTVLLRQSDSSLVAWLKTPVSLMEQIGKFDLDKRIERRGTKTVNGRQVDEVAMNFAGKDVFLLDVDSEKHVPVSMTLRQTSPIIPSERFDYTYDSAAVSQEIEGLKASQIGLKQLDIDGDKPAVRRQLFAKPLSVTSTGRDKLTIYQVSRNATGDVFVLYTCRGYHADEENMGEWLQLKDDDGVRWLTRTVNMFSSKLAPRGEGLKAQVFFHPESLIRVGQRPSRHMHLSIRLNEWEYLRANEPSSRLTREVGVGDFVPSQVEGVPVWFFYAFGIEDESWLAAEAKKLRFQHALSAGNYRTAIQIGLEFYDSFPDLMGSLFYTRPELARDLSKAYRGSGDSESAREFEAKSKGAGR